MTEKNVENDINPSIQMDFPICIDTISMGPPILHFKGSQVEFSEYCFFCP